MALFFARKITNLTLLMAAAALAGSVCGGLLIWPAVATVRAAADASDPASPVPASATAETVTSLPVAAAAVSESAILSLATATSDIVVLPVILNGALPATADASPVQSLGPVVTAVDASADIDTDRDGLSDRLEARVYHTDPNDSDTDDDGFADGQEVENGYSPRNSGPVRLLSLDTDKDYLNDAWEIAAGTDLLNPDTDGDLFLDGTEVAASYDPLVPKPVPVKKEIRVSLRDQQLSYYFDGKLFGQFAVSTGKKSTPTPVGEYVIQAKIPVKYYGGRGFSYPNTKWNLLFTRRNGWGYYIHGAYWHDKFGTPVSHGCVNVRYSDMERLYWWAQDGTRVVIE